ncbi:MAG: helix-turn-helix transcriptional regulator [Bacteroidota bacterium]
MWPEVHIDWLGGLLLLGSYQGIMTANLVWFKRKGKRIPLLILGAILLGMSLGLIQTIILFSTGLPGGGLLSVVTFGSAPFLYGPAIYFYIRAYINRGFHFRWVHAMHLLPYLIIIVLRLISWYLRDQSVAEQVEAIRSGNPSLEFKIVGLILISHLITYLSISLRIVRRYRRFVRKTSSFEDQTRSRWINWITLILLFPFLTALFSLLIFGPVRDIPIPAFAGLGMIFFLSLVYLFRPEVLDGVVPELAIETEAELETVRYSGSSLAEEQKDRISTQLLAHMTAEQAWRSQTLTLSEVAEALKVNQKYLSQVINEKHGLNFMDFINGYRIEEAQKMLRAPRFGHYTIVAIAQEVGFRSRSAFYAAFKKISGQTPTEYKRSVG